MIRAIPVVALLWLSFLPASSWAACSRNEYGAFEDVACAADAFAKADKELNEVYQQLLSRLNNQEKEKLKAAQRAWVAYKEANASFVYVVEGNGSAGRMVAWNQSEQATRARIKDLRSWLPRN